MVSGPKEDVLMTKRQRTIQPGQRIRVLIVDDSVVIRQLVTHALEADPTIEVVGVAANGSIAMAKIAQLNPDAVTLDIEMPEVDGLETLRRIRRDYGHLRVIMFSTLTERGAAVTLEALALGADDYVAKVSNEGSLDRSMNRLREELIPKIKQFFNVPVVKDKPVPVGGSKICWAVSGAPLPAVAALLCLAPAVVKRQTGRVSYSSRRASIGSRRDARRAGPYAARNAAKASALTAKTSVTGSYGFKL